MNEHEKAAHADVPDVKKIKLGACRQMRRLVFAVRVLAFNHRQ